MSVDAWRIAVDTPDYESTDLRGIGAKLTGGRWNRQGTPMIYAASSIALACLETMVHLDANALPLNRYLVRVSIPDDVWNARTVLTHKNAAVGWDALPPGKVSLGVGTRWCEREENAILCVPSIVVPEELNVLINPRHADARSIKATKIRRWTYDARVWT